jgi:Flp pilus assembly protein TadB
MSGEDWTASAREVAERSQSQMMGSTVFLGWIAVAFLLLLAWLGDSVGLLVGASAAAAATLCWHGLNYRKRHRWDRLKAKAADRDR